MFTAPPHSKVSKTNQFYDSSLWEISEFIGLPYRAWVRGNLMELWILSPIRKSLPSRDEDFFS